MARTGYWRSQGRSRKIECRPDRHRLSRPFSGDQSAWRRAHASPRPARARVDDRRRSALVDRACADPVPDGRPGEWRRHPYRRREYPMRQHGFARHKTFELVLHEPARAVFRLADSEETRAVYPFAFALDVSFTIDGRDLVDRHADRESRRCRDAGEFRVPSGLCLAAALWRPARGASHRVRRGRARAAEGDQRRPDRGRDTRLAARWPRACAARRSVRRRCAGVGQDPFLAQ